jgi:hypothetical protein
MKPTNHWKRGEVWGKDENIIEDANLFKVSYA